MHGLWRSVHGSGNTNDAQSREQYTFLDAPVDDYGATIVYNMLNKPTGYNPILTAEAIKVVVVWMGFTQSLYDAVSLCALDDNEDGEVMTTFTADVTDPGYVSPVDIAAAFWYGSYRRTDGSQLPENDGSLYAWAMLAKSNFSPTNGIETSLMFDANDAITSGLARLQTLLPECLSYRNQGLTDDRMAHALKMRILADDVTRYATVPMVQNLIHHCVTLAMGVSTEMAAAPVERRRRLQADDVIDWIILYGLALIPPLRVCDDNTFDDLYKKLVVDAKSEIAILDDEAGGNIESLDQEVLFDVLDTLYSRLTCLGLTCEHIIGTSSSSTDIVGPVCTDPTTDFDGVGYPYGDGSSTDTAGRFMQQLKIDLDMRTIGRLVEIDAKSSAYDVYRWGRHMRAVYVDPMSGRDVNDAEGVDVTMNNVALRDVSVDYHERNVVAAAYDTYLEGHKDLFTTTSAMQSVDDYEFADVYISEVMKGLGRFGGSDVTLIERRIILESAFPLILAHVHALDQFYEAVDDCRAGMVETTWDIGYAALSGWAQEDQYANGFLALAWTMCTDGSCDFLAPTSMSTLKETLLMKLKEGKESLRLLQANCEEADGIIKDIENLILTILVDAAAYYANQMSAEPLNTVYVAYGHSVAMALIPLMWSVDIYAAGVIDRNMGSFGPDATPLIDGLDVTIDALSTFVTANNTINCDLLSMKVLCGGAIPGPAPTTDDDGTYNPTMIVGGTGSNAIDVIGNVDDDDEHVSCRTTSDGGLPGKLSMDTFNNDSLPALLGGLYQPNSDVSHIIELTDYIELIANSTDESVGVGYYTDTGQDGVSLQCLSLGIQKDFILKTNPLFVITAYGLWNSESGDNDPDGYSNKLFNGYDVLYFGDTIVMDEFSKKSGYNGKFSAETIQVTNMWMAMITELYRAAQCCHDGMEMDFNPVDYAAALWFGTARDMDSLEGGSLYAWAKLAGVGFVEQTLLVTAEVTNRLKVLQTNFLNCQTLVDEDSKKTEGVAMKHEVDEFTRVLTVPMVQHFIRHLAIESGMTDQETTDERNHMVLYALFVLPLISICDMITSENLFASLIPGTEVSVTLNSDTFTKTMNILQDKYKCLGITCDMVGIHCSGENCAPACTDPSAANTVFAGYGPTSDESLEMLNIDIDISTILAFIIMEADMAALGIFRNGRNAKTSDGLNTYLSLNSIITPSLDTDASAIYQSYSGGADGRNYMEVTPHAISAIDAFQYTSLLTRSAAASLAVATIDLHMVILLYTNEAAVLCTDNGVDDLGGSNVYWDSAVAAYVGSSEGEDSGGSDVSGHLLFQLAQELCTQYGSCEDDGEPIINKKIMEEFTAGQTALSSGNCEGASVATSNIAKLIQAILIDLLAYHAILTPMHEDAVYCHMAHVAASALVPNMHSTSDTELIANTIQANIVVEQGKCQVLDVDAIYQSLNTYVSFLDIDCAWLGSSVCNGTSTTPDSIGYENNADYTLNTNNNSLFKGAYVPTTDVSSAEAVFSVVSAICGAASTDVAINVYKNDTTAGLSIEDMSRQAKYVMSEELLFHQYIYALKDGVDITDGSFLFDNLPAADYANTITSDALDTGVSLGCQSVKVLNIWMWIIHKLNAVVDFCKSNKSAINSGLVDEAAALWEGSQLFAMAEELGPRFSHGQDGEMTYLNRKIVDRLKEARDITSNNQNVCSNADVLALRILVKETVSYMTAVLFQSLIDSMLSVFDDNAKKVVELMAFATLPHIKSCGHHVIFDDLKGYLITGFSEDGDKIATTIETLQSHYNCLGLSCIDVGHHDATEGSSITAPECSDVTMIAGYVPENITKTNMVAKLDLDVVAIHHMMDMEKFELAKRIYLEGHNYYDYDNTDMYNFVSLYDLTQSHTIDYSDFAIYSLYNNYHGPDFSNQLLTQIFDKTGPFENATASKLSLAAEVAVTSIVSYMAALEALYSAASRCESEKISSIHAFDGAVALLIGSVEGQSVGGSLNEEGHMFYSIAKRNCNHFEDCVGYDSRVNEKIFLLLGEGQKFIQEGQCEAAKNEVDKINSLLKVPLAQTLLYFSDTNDVSENDAGAYVAMVAVIPTLDGIDSASADTIETAFDLDDPAEEVDVRNSLRVILSNPNSDIYCNLVSTGLCDADVGDSGTTDDGDKDLIVDVIQPPPNFINASDPTPIPFVTSNYVGDRSAIAIDVKQIQEAIAKEDFIVASQIYRNGRNSKIYSEKGIATGKLRSIAGFSEESGDIMKGDPTYNMFIYGLSDGNQEFMGRPTTEYADAIASNLLNLGAPEAEAAMVAITIWMQVAHSLHAAHDACRSSVSSNGRSGSDWRRLQQSSVNDPSLFIDEAAAYWMGDHQDTGSSSQGHLLYALTELIADKFETPSDSESTINTLIIDLLNKAKNHIAISRGCSTSEDSHLTLKGIIDEIIPLMAVPLLRCLIHYLNENELIMVKVFATAVLPLFSACSSSTYNELKSLLIDHIPYISDSSSVYISRKDVISQLQSMYNCLGLTCDLVGSMQKGETELPSACKSNSLAGYKLTEEEEDVNQASLIDIDIRKIEIFLENGMFLFSDSRFVFSGDAFGLYRTGQHKSNTDGRGSLRSIARSTNREIVPVFAAYRRYFDGDDYYADTMITAAFQKTGAFTMASDDQRIRFIAFALRYMITFMAILEKIYLALDSCSNEETRGKGATDLDMAIAYYMGSLEGKEDGGSYDGTLLHMLANRMCVNFGTCSENDNAVVNERIVSLVYTAQGELEVGACEMMKRTVGEIKNVLIVPLIQGILFSAKANEMHYQSMHLSAYAIPDTQEFIPEGYALAQSILPLIADADQNSATIIKDVMVNSFPTQGDKRNQDSAKVVSAIKSALSKMEGFDCSQIGFIGGTGFCPKDNEDLYDPFNSASYGLSSSASLMIAGLVLGYI